MKLFGKKLSIRGFNDLKIRTKIVLVVNILLVLFLIVFAFYLYNRQKSNITDKTDVHMFANVLELEHMMQSIKPQESGTRQIVVNSVDEELAGVVFIQRIDSIDVVMPRTEVIDQIKNEINTDLNEVYYMQLKSIYNNISYYNAGYPFLLSKNGTAIIHPTLEGDDFSGSVFFHKLVSQGKISGKVTYQWPETKFGDQKILYYKYHEPLDAYIVASFYENAIFEELRDLRIGIIISVLLISILFSISIWFFVNPIISKISILAGRINTLASGKIIDKFNNTTKDEIGEIMNSVDRLTDMIRKNTKFANEIGSGKLDSDFDVLGEGDVLGNALLEMRKSLKQSKEEEEKRKEEEEKQNWSSRGLAKFNDILRSNDNLSVLGDKITSEMTEYLDANQCALFVVNDEQQDTIDLISAYAYNRKKFLSKSINSGEGVAGTCLKEGKTIYLKNVPDDYIQVTSGLGQATPRELLVVPLRHEDKILGVFEIASFKAFEKHEIEFVEQVAETIASSVSNVMINQNTNKLLEQARHQAEQLASQEEEMRQTMEELSATQEEMQRKNKQMEELNQKFKDNETDLQRKIEKATLKEKELMKEIEQKNLKIQEFEQKPGK